MPDFPPKELLDKNPEYMSKESPAKYQLTDNGLVYVSKSSYYEACSIQDDIQSNPVLNFISKVAFSTFSVLACCLLYTCFKYKRLESHY